MSTATLPAPILTNPPTVADAAAFAERAMSVTRAVRFLNALSPLELADLRNLAAEFHGLPTDTTLAAVTR
jgi:hypothetical protein